MRPARSRCRLRLGGGRWRERAHLRSFASAIWVLAGLLGGCQLANSRAATPPVLSAADGWTRVTDVPLVRQRERADCGVAALTMVLARWQPTVSEPQVRAWLGPIDPQEGAAAARLRAVARQRGYSSFIVEGGLGDLEHELGLGRPVLLGVLRVVAGRGFPHYEVVVALNRRTGRIVTADPAEGWHEQDLPTFEARWRASRHLALMVLPPDGAVDKLTSR